MKRTNGMAWWDSTTLDEKLRMARLMKLRVDPQPKDGLVPLAQPDHSDEADEVGFGFWRSKGEDGQVPS